MEENVQTERQPPVHPPIPHLFSIGQRRENRGAPYSARPILATSLSCATVAKRGPVRFSSMPPCAPAKRVVDSLPEGKEILECRSGAACRKR